MTTLHRTPEPFLDWYAIWPGATAYEPDGRAWVSEAPQGVRLSVQPAERSEPVLLNDQPWEGSRLGYVNVLYEEGRYRMWYGFQVGLCYAESDDGFHWRKPALGLYERDGSSANNLVYPKGIEGTVFRDPNGTDTERYKLVDMEVSSDYQGRRLDPEGTRRVTEELRQQGLDAAEIYGKHLRLVGAVYGAASPDGLHWTRIEEPLFEKFCDTQNVVLYDAELGRYVGYWRSGAGRRRAIARSETHDFWHWPLPDMVLQPDGQDAPTDDYYTNAYTPYPDGGFHLMFPAIYRRVRDELDVQLAVSRDGLNWSWPQRSPIVPLDPTGADGVKSLYVSPGLVPLEGDRWGAILRCATRRHNESYYYDPPGKSGHYRWAIWKKGRLVALEAPVWGQVTLNPRELAGDDIRLNYQTAANGWIQAELVEPTLWPPAYLEPLEGYAFEECEPLRGDDPAGQIRWRGSGDLSALRGRTLAIRIRMCKAKLFSITT